MTSVQIETLQIGETKFYSAKKSVRSCLLLMVPAILIALIILITPLDTGLKLLASLTALCIGAIQSSRAYQQRKFLYFRYQDSKKSSSPNNFSDFFSEADLRTFTSIESRFTLAGRVFGFGNVVGINKSGQEKLIWRDVSGTNRIMSHVSSIIHAPAIINQVKESAIAEN